MINPAYNQNPNFRNGLKNGRHASAFLISLKNEGLISECCSLKIEKTSYKMIQLLNFSYRILH